MILARTKKSKADDEKKSKLKKGEEKKGGKQRGDEERNKKTQRREEEAMQGMRHVPGAKGCKKVNDEWTCVKGCAVAIAQQFFDKRLKRSSKKRKKDDEEEEQDEEDRTPSESDDEDEEEEEERGEEEKAAKKKKFSKVKFPKNNSRDVVVVEKEDSEEKVAPISRKLLNAGTSTDSICKCIIVLTSILRMAGIRKAVTCWGVEVGEYDPNSGGPGRETKSCSNAEKQLKSNPHIAASIARGEYTMQVLMSLTREKVSL